MKYKNPLCKIFGHNYVKKGEDSITNLFEITYICSRCGQTITV